MATLSRRPLVPRPLQLHIPAAFPQPKTTRTASSTKRARSPGMLDHNPVQATSPKRARGVQPSPTQMSHVARDAKDRELRKAEREARKVEFRVKYTRAFPAWVFYFDLNILDAETASYSRILEHKVSFLGARIDDFFSNEVTHLITNKPVPTDGVIENKENTFKAPPFPLKPRSRVPEESSIAGCDHLVRKAIGFGMKIWSTTKLESVLERCLPPTPNTTDPFKSTATLVPRTIPPSSTSASGSHQHPLSLLLQSERFHGTHERDPTQKRHDFVYFSRSSFFVLVEDLRQELATIATLEYPIIKNSDGKLKTTWPVLHCHPHARGPFIEFDEREKRRWERSRMAESNREEKTRNLVIRGGDTHLMKAQFHAKRRGDLRRSVSMNNLHRQASHSNFMPHGMIDLDADSLGSANPSGYLASTGTGGAYMAASGNSVGITSTTGTTSNTGDSRRNLQLPATLRERIQQQVITSRKYPSGPKAAQVAAPVAMGPPKQIPDKPALLRRCRSTNTLRLPKREEGTKPGYCENCRIKFDDFGEHIRGRKHRKFSVDDANFLQLDFLLLRVQRRTIRQVAEEMKGDTPNGPRCDEDGCREMSPQSMQD